MAAGDRVPADLLAGGTWLSGATFARDIDGKAAHDAWRIARALRLQRKARGLTQVEVAERAGVSVRSVRDIERGTVWPSLRTVSVIASALGAHVGIVRPKR